MVKSTRKIIEIDEELCNGCGRCVTACSEGALAIVDGKAKLVSEILCDGLGACLGECPTGALRIVEKEVEESSENVRIEQVSRGNLKEAKTGASTNSDQNLACGCPSHHLRELKPKNTVSSDTDIPSSLSNWPVQITLIPAGAPFLKNARLLVCADCVPVAYPRLHVELLPDRKIMIGCPKFDPVDLYVEKFAEIFKKVPLESVEVAIMEVPCCKGLIRILDKAREIAKIEIPFKIYTIGVSGEILKEEIL